MIEFPRSLIVEHVVEPQAAADVPEDRRIYLDKSTAPIDSDPQEVDLLSITTTPQEYEIGGGLTLRHTISVAVDVQHGDPVESRRRRDLISTDLVLRALDRVHDGTFGNASDPATGQEFVRFDFSIDYRPLGTADTNESAVLSFVLDMQLDR